MVDVQLYVIRVWQQLNPFRASIRAVGQEEPHFFSAPEEVSDFLRRAADSSVREVDPPIFDDKRTK